MIELSHIKQSMARQAKRMKKRLGEEKDIMPSPQDEQTIISIDTATKNGQVVIATVKNGKIVGISLK